MLTDDVSIKRLCLKLSMSQEGKSMADQELETKSVRMKRMYLLAFQVPAEDVDRIMGEVVKIVPLAMGCYDRNFYQSGSGIERYRPLEGAAAGAETEVRKRTGTVEVSFEIPDHRQLVEQVVETIFATHSYQEPVIRVQAILSSRSKGLDDRANPNRWWNTTGDWKKPSNQSVTEASQE
jgi:hypothetical protein